MMRTRQSRTTRSSSSTTHHKLEKVRKRKVREKVKETSLKRRIKKTLNTKAVVSKDEEDFEHHFQGCCHVEDVKIEIKVENVELENKIKVENVELENKIKVEDVESEIKVVEEGVDTCTEVKVKCPQVEVIEKDNVVVEENPVAEIKPAKKVKKEKAPRTKRSRKAKRSVETMESLVSDFVESFLTGIEDDSFEGELSTPFAPPPAPSNIFDKIQSNIPGVRKVGAIPRYNINSTKFFKSFKNCQRIIQEEAQREFEENAKLKKNLKFLDSINTKGYEWITANNTNLEQFHDNSTISEPGVNWDVLEEYIKEDSKTTPLVPLTAEDIDQFFAHAITRYYHIPHYHRTDLTNYTYSNLFNVPPWSDVPVPSIPNVPDSYTPSVGTKSPCLKNVYSYRRRSSETSER